MEFAPMRSLLVAVQSCPGNGRPGILPSRYLVGCQALYLKGSRKLPVGKNGTKSRMIWRVSISSPDQGTNRFRR